MTENTVTGVTPDELPEALRLDRERTAIDEAADAYYEEYLALHPDAATIEGRPGHETEYPDFGPAGRAARAELVRSTLARLEEVTPEDDVDRVTLHAMRNELELERDRHEANLDVSAVNNIESPVQGIRQVLDAMDAAAD